MKTVTILVCGSRNWKNFNRINEVLNHLYDYLKKNGYENITLVHGDCRGADKIGGFLGEKIGFKIRRHPADWYKDGKKAGVLRNQKMLDENKIDLCIAFTNDLEKSIGTKDMTKRCRKANIPTILFGERNEV